MCLTPCFVHVRLPSVAVHSIASSGLLRRGMCEKTSMKLLLRSIHDHKWSTQDFRQDVEGFHTLFMEVRQLLSAANLMSLLQPEKLAWDISGPGKLQQLFEGIIIPVLEMLNNVPGVMVLFFTIFIILQCLGRPSFGFCLLPMYNFPCFSLLVKIAYEVAGLK